LDNDTILELHEVKGKMANVITHDGINHDTIGYSGGARNVTSRASVSFAKND
jgi:hypothetical protein